MQQPVRIDIGFDGRKQSHSFFSGFQLGSFEKHRFNQESATGNERQGLLKGSESSENNSCLQAANRFVPICVCFLCALATATIVVFLVLFYTQVSSAVSSIDETISLKTKTVNMIRNFDSILNSTARTVQSINKLAEKPTISIG